MNVSYTLPLQQAWNRMVRMLFRPFRIETWLTVGFAAFLSEYLSHFHGSGGSRWSMREHVSEGPMREGVRRIAEFFLHPVWGPLILCIIIVAAIVALLLMWVSSRGKFVFLDDVIRERSAIVEPWRRFAAQGNSLFFFWVALLFVSVTVVIVTALPVIPAILTALAAGGAWRALGAVAIGWWLAALIPLALVAGYVHLFLFQFVVPIMYRDGLGVFAAWARFFTLFRANVLHFLVFGLFWFILMILFGLLFVVAGVSFCCMGFLVLSFPYVGSVVLLPLEITLRGLGPDFLAQFGPEWTIAPPAPPASGVVA